MPARCPGPSPMTQIQANTKTITVKSQEDREAQQRPLDLGLIRRMMSYTNDIRRKRNLLLLCVFLRGIQLPLLSWIIAAVIHGPIKDRNPDGVMAGALGFLAFVVFTFVTFRYRQRLALELGEHVVHHMRRDLFDHLQRMSMRFYDRTKLGSIISRMVSDIEQVRMGVQNVLFVSLVQGLQMIGAALIMAWYDLPLFGLVLAMAPIIWALNRYFRPRLSTAFRSRQESFSRVTATLAESVNGVRVTQGFGRQGVNAELFRGLILDHSSYNYQAARLAGTFLPLLDLNSQIVIGALVTLGGVQVLHGGFFAPGDAEVGYEALVAFFFLVPLFFEPIRNLGQQYQMALSAMAGGERFFKTLDVEPEQLDKPDAHDLPVIDGHVAFENVTFGYDPDKPVLHELDFTVEPGQTFALVGQTGSGKTSIINLICKFYLPTAGRVRVDGHDLAEITSDSLLSQLGIVLQQNFLFTGTIMDNIRVGRQDATDDEVFDAARKLDCLDLLEQLPDGLYTQVGEKGASLSLGQRQLVCFTRAMLADPRILILDEATSSVDTMTEARIQKALETLLRGRTSFVVAHRLSTIRHADQVLVLEQGRIIERGSHTHLLARGGAYSALYRQFIRASEG